MFPVRRRDLCSSGTLRSVEWQRRTDISKKKKPITPIFKVQEVQEDWLISVPNRGNDFITFLYTCQAQIIKYLILDTYKTFSCYSVRRC